MVYTEQITRENPSCFVFVIDQSGSMVDPFGGQFGFASDPGAPRSKASRLADAMNRALFELVINCTKGEEDPRHYYDVGVIGYGNLDLPHAVGPALAGPLAGQSLVPIHELAKNPIRVEDRIVEADDGAGGVRTSVFKLPIWFQPVASGGTPTKQALQQARDVLAPWIEKHPNSFPPIVIHITDGEADEDPSGAADTLRSLTTTDGNVLLFNLHLSSRQLPPILYPEDDIGLPDRFARQLFNMSSVLPPPLQERAASKGFKVGAQSRGFVFNADFNQLVHFLDIGTHRELR